MKNISLLSYVKASSWPSVPITINRQSPWVGYAFGVSQSKRTYAVLLSAKRRKLRVIGKIGQFGVPFVALEARLYPYDVAVGEPAEYVHVVNAQIVHQSAVQLFVKNQEGLVSMFSLWGRKEIILTTFPILPSSMYFFAV